MGRTATFIRIKGLVGMWEFLEFTLLLARRPWTLLALVLGFLQRFPSCSHGLPAASSVHKQVPPPPACLPACLPSLPIPARHQIWRWQVPPV